MQDQIKKLEELVEGMSYAEINKLFKEFQRDVLPAKCIASSEKKIVQ